MNVSLRKLAESDTANIVLWRNAEDVKRWLFSQDEVTEEMHLRWFHDKVEPGFCAQYIINLEEEERRIDIGTTFIKRKDLTSELGEFGIFIGEPSAKGKHCALPATKNMLRIGFNELKLDRIFLEVFSDNIPAIKTYLHAGFRKTGENEYIKDKEKIVYTMEINKVEFLAGGGKIYVVLVPSFGYNKLMAA